MSKPDTESCLPQTILRSMNGTVTERLEALNKVYGVNATRGEDFPNLVSIKYNQLESPLGDSLVQQCRGIIFDTEDNWSIVARPFDKFFNFGEKEAANIDWSSAIAQEKLDGTCMVLYHYAGKWRVATLGTPDAAGPIGAVHNNNKFTFGMLFEWLWQVRQMKYPPMDWRHVTFMFEMMTPYNRVVCQYPEKRIVFLGARSTIDGTELSIDEVPFRPWGWEGVRTFPLHTLVDIQQSFREMSPLEQEGYVVLDNAFRRLKVKHPGYIALHHLRGNGILSARRIIETLRVNETKELLTAFPEWTDDFLRYEHAIASLIGELEDEYRTIAFLIPKGNTPAEQKANQKKFATTALKSRCSAALFGVRSGKAATIKDFVNHLNVETLLILLDVKGPDEAVA